jgi:hypothetical protein
VVNTKQLDNVFLLSTNMEFDKAESSSSQDVYISKGSLLSINDYSDESLVEACIAQRCAYVVTALVVIKSSIRMLYLDINYTGGKGLNQQIFFSGINMAFGDEVSEIRFQNPLMINGPTTAEYPIPEQQSNLKTQ